VTNVSKLMGHGFG